MKRKNWPELPAWRRKNSMCGIAGILNLNREPVGQRQIKAMTDSIAHRGPDGEGYFGDEMVGLGHRRLSIIDLTNHASQPMMTSDGRYSISYNGEMYNFQALRKTLEGLGYHFFSSSDTEVVLNAFAEWHEKCLDHFNGMVVHLRQQHEPERNAE